MSERVLPEEWVETMLGQVVEYGKAEKVTPEQVDDDTWVLELEDIEKFSSRIIQHLSFSERQFKSTKNRFKKGDVLYGKLRPYLDKVVIADRDGVCTTEIVPLDARPHLDNRYLFYWLKSLDFLSYVNEVGYGVNMPRLGTKEGKGAPFVLAPKAEQKVIADKLDELLAQVNNLKARLDAIPAILKRFRKSVLKAAVSGKLTESWRDDDGISEDASSLKKRWLEERRSDFYKLQQQLVDCGKQRGLKKFKEPVAADVDMLSIDLPKGWCAVSVSEYAECLDKYRVPVKKERRAGSEKLYPYFGANGEVDRVDEYIFDDDLVMVTEDETFYGREKPIAYRYTGKCWVNNHVHVLRAPTKQANDYLCYSLMYYNVLPWLSGTTGRAKLTQAALNSMPITLPPEEELNEIVRRVDQLFAFADQIEQQVANAQARVDKLTQSILAKAFRGELTAEWRAENPELISGEHSAAALLERIKAEKAKQTPAGRGRKKAATEATGSSSFS